MNRKYPMILVMKSMLQFVAVMDKLIQMIAMLKMQVSQNGLKASVNKKPELHQAPPSSGVFCLWDYMYIYITKGDNYEKNIIITITITFDYKL